MSHGGTSMLELGEAASLGVARLLQELARRLRVVFRPHAVGVARHRGRNRAASGRGALAVDIP